ncbi:tetratricopeptide repeat protein [Nocardia arizonensis]|uniref:tetratricopeptide repeat protein n=1 Tax=Nocardia arizonensis TaxID=1141647 RepID=UPI000A8D1AA1|nr:tetratricopeptide repeat protein [Nocardia arizonensis]
MADPRYERAKALRGEGRVAEAEAVLRALAAERPDDVAALYALAVCRIDLGQREQARATLLRVLRAYPGHYEAEYQLARFAQEDGDLVNAAAHYRNVLAAADYADAEARLRQCERGAVVLPVRQLIEQSHVADPGTPKWRLRLLARHILPLGSIAVLPSVFVAVNLADVVDFDGGLLLVYVLMLAVAAAVVNLALAPITIYLRTRAYTAVLYDHGMDVSAGIFRRSKQFVWYYQITEPPTYVRTLRDYLTNTASLAISYNNTATTTSRVVLRGIGSPRRVEQVRSFLRGRIPAERLPIRGPWT